MSDYFIGEIRVMAGLVQGQPPADWHVCDGSKLPINQYQALYSLLGTTYGGDGRNDFGLPDLRGRVPINQGTGVVNPTTKLTPRVLGQKGGVEAVGLTDATMPAHTHALCTAGVTANSPNVAQNVTFANAPDPNTMYVKDGLPTTAVTKASPGDTTIGNAGASQPHDNIMPCTAMSYIIALNGIYPQES
ncbi:phage tail protein [Hydrogenophaga soli]